jgi:prepilin-type N-terminal cleavage/methylation domain-containing protein
MKRRTAFTLIETIVALLILGIMAGAGAWSFRSSLQSASSRDVVDQLRFLDSTSRQRAQRFAQPVEIIFDISESILSRRDDKRRTEDSFRTSLPRGYRIDQINISGRSSLDGEISITCSPNGHTPSYAIHLLGPDFDQWLLFAGLTGQLTIIKDEATVQDILANTGAPRRDAH